MIWCGGVMSFILLLLCQFVILAESFQKFIVFLYFQNNFAFYKYRSSLYFITVRHQRLFVQHFCFHQSQNTSLLKRHVFVKSTPLIWMEKSINCLCFCKFMAVVLSSLKDWKSMRRWVTYSTFYNTCGTHFDNSFVLQR